MPSPIPEQEAIIHAAHTGASIMGIACAGSGKTTTAVMAAQALPSRNLLCCAFNVKIKEEMEKRMPEWATVKTQNGLGHSAWARSTGKRLNVDRYKMREVIKPLLKHLRFEDSQELFQDILKLSALAKHAGIVPKDAQKPYQGLLEDTDENWKELASAHFISEDTDTINYARRALCESIAQAYEGLIDFDDQIYMPTLFGSSFPRYDIIIVDEAQDLSPLNHRQLSKIYPRQVLAFGDPKQAIYAFRGADSRSMANLATVFKGVEFEELPLATSFRCPKKIVERQQDHYPNMRAWHTNPEGNIDHWAKWTEDKLLPGTAVLCRNNAPLVDMAFKLLRAKMGFNFIGRDIGKNLKSLINRATGKDKKMPRQQALEAVVSWREMELAKHRDKPDRIDAVMDRAESMVIVLAATENVEKSFSLIDEIFADKDGQVTLSTGHKAKGLEWKTVLHLDPWRIPSKFATQAAEQGHTAQLEQENNLRYVIETRTINTLMLAEAKRFGDE